MKTREVLDQMRKGAVLCMEHGEDGKDVFWLEPRHHMVRSDVARGVITSSVPGGDSLFGEAPQTWRVPR